MNENASNPNLHFFLGGNGKDVWLDGVIVREKCAAGDQTLASAARSAALGVSDVSVYPNPVSRHTPLTVQWGNLRPVDLQVVDLAGRVLVEKSLENASTGTLQLDLPRLTQPGLYLIKFRSDGQQWTRKLMVE